MKLGMHVHEAAQMTHSEYNGWIEFFKIEAENQEKAEKEARRQAKNRNKL